MAAQGAVMSTVARPIAVHIRSFRSLRDAWIPIRKYTVLIGANDAGKSNALQALGWSPYTEGELDRLEGVPADVVLFGSLPRPVSEMMRVERDDAVTRLVGETMYVARLGDSVVAAVGRRWLEAKLDERNALASDPRLSPALEEGGSGTLIPMEWLPVEGVAFPEAVTVHGDPEHASDDLTRYLLETAAPSQVRVPDVTVMAALREGATGLAPRFVLDEGDIRISEIPGPDSLRGQVRRELDALSGVVDPAHLEGLARLCVIPGSGGILERSDVHYDVSLQRAGGEPFRFAQLGRGTRRWLAAALAEAARRHAGGSETAMFLVDEPGESVHPRAQEDVMDWMEARIAERGSVVITTHNPAFLSPELPHQDVSIVGLSQDPDGASIVTAIEGDQMTELLDAARWLGVTPPSLLLATRAVLVVEGPTDVALLRHFYGRSLERRRVQVHEMGGSSVEDMKRLLLSDVFRHLDVPVFVLLDSKDGDPDPTASRRRAQELAEALRAAGRSFHPIEMPVPDAVCWMSEKSLREAGFGGLEKWDWVELARRRSNIGKKVKAYFKRQAPRRFDGQSPHQIVESLVREDSIAPSVYLERVMQELFRQLREGGVTRMPWV